jgi:lycopene cyclase domain-containing protein
MTYGSFHLLFNLPVLLLFSLWPGQPILQGPQLIAALVVLAIVMVFTSPWDNYAVARGIWGFPRDKYSFRIKHLPVEEYLFFIIQSVEVMLLVNLLVAAGFGSPSWFQPDPASPSVGVPMTLFFIAWIVLGITARGWLKRNPRFRYTWHLFYWFGPVIIAQWILAWPILVPRLSMIVIPTLALGTWLSFADRIAIGRGLWHFDEKQITGWKLHGVMPWEEIAFFYGTSLVVAQSYLILLPEAAR